MAIGWWSALQMIPWGQVIEHAPVVLKGARRLMERHRGTAPPAPPSAPEAAVTPESADARVARLEATQAALQAELAAVTEQLQQSDEVLASLAEQNARLVAAVETLRLRTRLLLGTTVLLALGGAGLAWKVLGG